MNRVLGVLIVVPFIAACGWSPSCIKDGKTAEEWQAVAVVLAARNVADRALREKALAPGASVVSILHSNPCFEFARDEVGRKQQQTACDYWLETIERTPAEKSTPLYELKKALPAIRRTHEVVGWYVEVTGEGP